MRSLLRAIFFAAIVCTVLVPAAAAQTDGTTAPPSATVQQLADKVRDAIVVITFAGRDGNRQGLGTGFVIDKRGLIATNLHVIGEGRPIEVQTAAGKALPVKAIHASDRGLDLAILEVDAGELPALDLGDSDRLAQGEAILVMGNPHGLKHSVVSGVVSGRREIDSRKMIQLAMPVEPGNSGGPVLDMQGRVVGIVTLKSAVTDNLGFAVEVNALRPLVAKPNPVALERWLTIGTIDRKSWQPLFGARWQQRGGRILVDGLGAGFGGRSLLLAHAPPPELPFELAVSVKLDEEAGAAGLVFHADGGDRHYGFYPSNGKLRLSRFEGPDVFSWQVLAEKPSDAYIPGQWNRLRVRVEKDKLSCFVNGAMVIESSDDTWTSGRVGVAKFRTTQAEFRHFAVAKQLPGENSDREALARLSEKIDQLPTLSASRAESLAALSADRPLDVEAALLTRAKELDTRARELRLMAADVRLAAVVKELEQAAGPQVPAIDLARAALIIARLDEEDVEVESYVGYVDRMAEEIRARLAPESTESQKLAALNDYLFKEQGFHGSRTDYYHRANSYLSRVLDDREGLPITLSVLYIELAARLGVTVEGVGLPAHFVVRHVPKAGEPQLIDVFDGAKSLSREQAEKLVLEMTGERPEDEHFRAMTARPILQRILQNLLGIAQRSATGPDREAIHRYTSALVALDPSLVRERGLRAVVRWETGRRDAAVADIQTILDAQPEGIDLDELRSMQEYFRTTRPPQH